MATLTLQGTATAAASGTVASKISIVTSDDDFIVVGAVYDQSAGTPSCNYGNVKVPLSVKRESATSGIGLAVFVKPRVWNGRTATVTVTWPTATTNKSIDIYTGSGVSLVDIEKGNIQDTASTTPNTLNAATDASSLDTIFLGFHASNGNTTDSVGIPDATDGFTNGQTAGTNTGTADRVIYSQYLNPPTSVTTPRSRRTGMTSNQWCSILIVIKADTYNDLGLVPSEFYQVQDKFVAVSKEFDNAVFHYNAEGDFYEVFDVDVSTLTAVSNSKDGWDV